MTLNPLSPSPNVGTLVALFASTFFPPPRSLSGEPIFPFFPLLRFRPEDLSSIFIAADDELSLDELVAVGERPRDDEDTTIHPAALRGDMVCCVGEDNIEEAIAERGENGRINDHLRTGSL